MLPRSPMTSLPCFVRPSRVLLSLALAITTLCAGCAQDGEEETLRGDVPLVASLNLVALIAQPDFGGFPVTPSDTNSFLGVLDTRMDLTYLLTEASTGNSTTQTYVLEEDGRFSLLTPTSTFTAVFRGVYGTEGKTGHLVLTDRVGAGIGLYLGTSVPTMLPAIGDFVGDWHAFGLQTIFAPGTSTYDPDLVGTAFAGSIAVAMDGSVIGTAVESGFGNVALTGAAGDFEVFEDGGVTLEMEFDPPTAPDFERGWTAAGSPTACFGIDPDDEGNDDGTGLLVLMRHRTAAFDMADLAGTFRIGLSTIFLDPQIPGSDAALGDLVLEEDGDWELTAESNTGVLFTFSGTFTADADGSLEFSVDQGAQTWSGAFDDGYDSVVVLDAFKEAPSANASTELNLGVALRLVPSGT